MTEAAEVPQKPLIRKGSIIRAIVNTLILLPFLAPAPFIILAEIPYYTGGFRSSPFIFFVILFPPAWWIYLVIHFRDTEDLAWNQHVTSVVIASFFNWFLLLNWYIGMYGMLARSLEPFGVDSLNMAFGITVRLSMLGGVILSWIAGYYALRSLPPPLGHRVRLY